MSKTMKFRFEPVLKLRKRKEQLSRERLAGTLAAAEAAAARLDRIACSLRRLNAAAAASLGSADELAACRQQTQELLLAQAQGQADLARLRRVAMARREEFVQDMNRRKAIGRLRERLWAAGQARDARAEARELDDLHATHATFQQEALWTCEAEL